MASIIRYGLSPCLIAITLTTTQIAKELDIAPLVVVFNVIYVGLAVTVFFIEHRMPFERAWLANDGQMLPDLTHTLFNKGIAQVMLMVGGAFGVVELAAGRGPDIWPGHWPMALQVLLGLVVAEFGLC